MAKKSMVERNLKRTKLASQYEAKRVALKEIIYNRDLPLEQRMQAQRKLSELPRNASKSRIRNRCEITGRPRGYYRYFRLSRLMLRDLGNAGMVPGLTKSSW